MTRFRAVMTCIAVVAASLIGFAAEPVGAVPAAPTTAPDLLAASDTGGSSTDNITGVVTPTFTVVCGTGVNSVNLYVNGVASGSAPCAGATTNVTVASPLSSGTYAARYTRLDALGDESPLSTASLSFTVDATAPAAPSMPPDLQAASDLGTFDDDNVTKDNTPTFSLSCTNGDSVTLFIDGASAGTAGCSGGTAAVTTAVLLDGVHAATYSEADPYANTSALSPALTLTIDTVYYDIRLERADMQAASDTGSSPTDNNTSDTTPTIQTACNAGDMVRWWLNFSTYWGIAPCVDGLAVFTHTVPLANGTQKISFDRIDLAGASAWRSQDLTLTIDSVAPNIPGAPNLQAASDTGTSNTDDLTNDTTPTFDVACETGTTVTLLMAGTALTSFPCYSGNSWLTLTLANGTHTVSAIDTDVAGNVSGSSLSFTFTIDTTPPSAPGTAPDLNAASDSGWSNTDNLTNNAYPTLTFACANAFVNLTTDTKAPVTAPCVGGTASITTVGLTDGAHTMKYTETDAAGNVGAFSPGLVVTIDTVGTLRPTNAPDLHASSDTGSSSVDNITRSTTPTFTIACTTGNLSILVVDSVNNGWTECLGGTSTIAATALSEGAHTIAYRSADYAGNQSNIGSVALAITIDTTAPTTTTPDLVTASDTGTSTTDNITNDTTATINIVCTTGNAVAISVDDATIGTVSCVAGLATITTSALANGNHVITYVETDVAGNASATSPSLTITIDTVAPATSATAPDLVAASDSGASSNDNNTNDTTPTFDVVCIDDDKATFTVDGTAASTALCTGGMASLTIAPLADGIHTIRYVETDIAGNVSGASPALTFIIDTGAPATAAASPDLVASSDNGASSSDNITNDDTPALTVGCATGNAINVAVDDVSIGTILCVDNTAAITTGLLADGNHYVTSTETDNAGNVSAVSPTLVITIDTTTTAPSTAPDLTPWADTGSSSIDNNTNDDTPTLDVVCVAETTVTFFINGIQASTAACVDGTVSLTTATLIDGTYAISFTETDTAGNVSDFSPSLALVVDTTDPTAPTGPPDLVAASDTGNSTADDITRDETPTFTVACGPDTVVTITVDDTTIGALVCADSYATITTSALADGAHAIAHSETDTAGNISEWSPTLTFTVDTIAPASPLVAPDLAEASDSGWWSNDDITNDTSVTISAICTTDTTVTLHIDDTVADTATCTENTASFTTTALTDGTHAITYIETDTAGNVSVESPTLSTTIDTTAPTAPLVTNAPIAGTTVRGSGEPGAAITIVDSNANTACETMIAADGSWVCELAAAPIPDTTLTVRAVDIAGNESATTASVAPAKPEPPKPDPPKPEPEPEPGDRDGDGVLDAVENRAGDGTGDGNGDGIADAQQPNVVSVLNAVNHNVVTLAVAGDDFAFISAQATNAIAPATFSYPVGLFDYRLVGHTPGATATVTVYFADRFGTEGWVAHKFIDGDRIDYPATFSETTFNGRATTTMTFAITDGGSGDDDRLANAVIVDPIGPAMPAVPKANIAFTGRSIAHTLVYGLLGIAVGTLLVGKRRQRLLDFVARR